jgi:nucleotide-binding universal stress UspA family protein
MKKMLIAVDDSEDSRKAVEYVGQNFSSVKDLWITLFHVLLGFPTHLWDDGHVLTREEKTARKAVIDTWVTNQREAIDAVFQEAIETLTRCGIHPRRVETKVIPESIKAIDQCILAEARAGGYQTVVIGRCRRPAKHFLLGPVANKIVHSATGMTVCVVD